MRNETGIHSLGPYLLSAYYASGTALGSMLRARTKEKRIHFGYISVVTSRDYISGERDSHYNTYKSIHMSDGGKR